MVFYSDSHAAEEDSDVMQQAKATVEAGSDKEKPRNGITAGGGATTEDTSPFTVSK